MASTKTYIGLTKTEWTRLQNLLEKLQQNCGCRQGMCNCCDLEIHGNYGTECSAQTVQQFASNILNKIKIEEYDKK